MNTPTGNAVTTAEHALGLFSIARKIPQASQSMKEVGKKASRT
jgi:phosphoglycerate dehydrogenase-like enzyme